MRLRKMFNQLVEEINSNNQAAYDHVSRVDSKTEVNGRGLRDLRTEFYELRDELARNGVIRDIRDLQKRVDELEKENQELRTNGVATRLNELSEEVFNDNKTSGFSFVDFIAGRPLGAEEPTLAGKVNAIVEHLGLELEVQPEKTTEAKVVASKKKTTKKKGKR